MLGLGLVNERVAPLVEVFDSHERKPNKNNLSMQGLRSGKSLNYKVHSPSSPATTLLNGRSCATI